MRKKKSSYCRSFIFVICFLLTLLYCTPVEAKDESVGMEEIEAFTDQFIVQNMDKYHIPGAAIAFVKDDEIAFIKGYGFADYENKIKVNPEKTVFGIGSISKLLTATAVMQQFEVGKLALNDDVNNYLSAFQIKHTFEQPVTIGSLLTHSSGFIQSSIGIGTRDTNKVLSLEDYLKTGLPDRKYQPDLFFSYSNQGMSLAGYVVECTSQTTFEEYIKDKIFTPLDMKNSTFTYPLSDISAKQAVGYGYDNRKQEWYRTEPIYYHIVPAGGCYSTVEDMAKFMIANLNNGQYQDEQILKQETMDLMHEQHFTHNERMPGQAYGFWESYENNIRGLYHTGTTDGYAGMLFMIPDEKIGFILSYNIASEKFRTEFLKEFLDTFYPVQNKQNVNTSSKNETMNTTYEGLYWNIEKPRDTIDKMEVLMSDGLVRVKQNKDGTLNLSGYYGEDMGIYEEIEEAVFQNLANEEIITFEVDDTEKLQSFLYKGNNAFEKVKWYENPLITIILGIVSFVGFIISPIIWIRKFIKHNSKDNILLKSEGYLGLISSLMITLLCVVTALVTMKLGKYAFMFGIPLSLKLLLLIPKVLFGILIIMFLINLLAWKRHYWTKGKRIYSSTYLLTLLLFLLCLNYWNIF